MHQLSDAASRSTQPPYIIPHSPQKKPTLTALPPVPPSLHVNTPATCPAPPQNTTNVSTHHHHQHTPQRRPPTPHAPPLSPLCRLHLLPCSHTGVQPVGRVHKLPQPPPLLLLALLTQLGVHPVVCVLCCVWGEHSAAQKHGTAQHGRCGGERKKDDGGASTICARVYFPLNSRIENVTRKKSIANS